MKTLALFLIFSAAACYAQTAQGITFTSGHGGSGNYPSSAPYASMSNFRLELRLHACTGSGNAVYADNDFNLEMTCGSNICAVSWRDNSQIVCTNLPAGATDITVRFQRVLNQYLSVELWRTDTGDYKVTTATPSSWGGAASDAGGVKVGVGNTNAVTVDYARVFSTVVALSTRPSPNPGGDWADWEFDGNYSDSSSNRINMSAVGSNSFTATPTYAPVIAFTSGRNCFFSASYSTKFCTVSNQTAALASSAYSPNLNDTINYSWTLLTGPTNATIVNSTSANATATGLSLFGEYDFQLTATDSEGEHTSGTLVVGSVIVSATNSCIITSVPSNVAGIVGPLTPWGSSCDPWPWYDIAEIGVEQSLRAYHVAPASDSNSVNPGTITVASNGTITGSGTHFTSDCGGTCSGKTIAILWNADGGTGSGRYLVTISVTNDTSASIGGSLKPPAADFVNVQYRVVNGDDWNYWYSGNTNWNYYDQAIAMYRIYYRTGITQFLTDAQTLVDLFWTYGLDHGYGTQVGLPRTWALGGVMVRALETGNTAMWNGIEYLTGVSTTCSACQHTADVREEGYGTLYYALRTLYDPNLPGNPTAQSSVCSNLAGNINNHWMPMLNTDASGNVTDTTYWGQNAYGNNASYPNSAPDVEAWQAGITGIGFARASDALASPGCNNPTAALHAQNLAVSTANFVYQYGATGNRTIPPANGGGKGRVGVTYQMGAQADGENSLAPCSGRLAGAQQIGGAPCTAGTISGTAGSPIITGSGTNFVSGGFCNSLNSYNSLYNLPNFLGITASGAFTGQEVHQIASCDSDTQITLTGNVVTSFSGRYYQVTPTDAYATYCFPGKEGYCEGAGTPDFVLETGGMFGWVFNHTRNLMYRIWGDDLYGATYGGADGGPGAAGSATTGVMASGSYAFSYFAILPACTSSTPPCGGSGGGYQLGKPFGQGSGIAGAADNYFAYRLMLNSN